jgi:hypothetical protein
MSEVMHKACCGERVRPQALRMSGSCCSVHVQRVKNDYFGITILSRTAATVPEHQVQDVCIVGIRVAAGVRVLLDIGAADNRKDLRAHNGGHLRVP